MAGSNRRLQLLSLAAAWLALQAWAGDPIYEKKAPRPKALPTISAKLNSLLGLTLAQGSALIVGGQLGFPASSLYPVYAGPELDFSLYSPGSMYLVLGTFWYDIKFEKTPKSGFAVGGGVGMALPEGLTRFPNLTYAAFVDLAIHQEVDRDVFIRGQFKPGVIGRYFAFMMNMNLTFVFR